MPIFNTLCSNQNSTTTSIWSGSPTYNVSSSVSPRVSLSQNLNRTSKKYNILGEEIEIQDDDEFLAQNLALINVLGKSYYDELLKNGFEFCEQVDKILKEKFIVLERDRKINSVIDDRRDEK